jgi:hypothetical protein
MGLVMKHYRKTIIRIRMLAVLVSVRKMKAPSVEMDILQTMKINNVTVIGKGK